MSDSKSSTGPMLAAAALTMVVGVILSFASKWFLSFVINHWFLVLVIVLAIVFGGLSKQFLPKKDGP